MDIYQNKDLSQMNRMPLVSLLFIFFIPTLLNGQLSDADQKNRKDIGKQTLTIDIGLFTSFSNYYTLGQSNGFLLGVEKRRQRLFIGPIFGKNIFFAEPNDFYGLTGFVADYSFTFFQPVKQFQIAVAAQFQYNYQDRIIYYQPPAETLILNSKYRESFFGLFGLDARLNIISNFQLFTKVGLGFESRKTQVFFPYYPPYNKYENRIYIAEYFLFGLAYGFPMKNRGKDK